MKLRASEESTKKARDARLAMSDVKKYLSLIASWLSSSFCLALMKYPRLITYTEKILSSLQFVEFNGSKD